jgi:hypothetical protein
MHHIQVALNGHPARARAPPTVHPARMCHSSLRPADWTVATTLRAVRHYCGMSPLASKQKKPQHSEKDVVNTLLMAIHDLAVKTAAAETSSASRELGEAVRNLSEAVMLLRTR